MIPSADFTLTNPGDKNVKVFNCMGERQVLFDKSSAAVKFDLKAIYSRRMRWCVLLLKGGSL
jgi:hypothetical protein